MDSYSLCKKFVHDGLEKKIKVREVKDLFTEEKQDSLLTDQNLPPYSPLLAHHEIIAEAICQRFHGHETKSVHYLD